MKLLFLDALSTLLSQIFIHQNQSLYTKEYIHKELSPFIDRLYFLFEIRCNVSLCDENKFKQEIVLHHHFFSGEVALLAFEVVKSVLKTNFFSKNADEAIAFRLSPKLFEAFPKTLRKEVFPHAPFGFFYIYSNNLFGFHLRFRDLARGGLRTVIAEDRRREASILLECYLLAWTQRTKNKDIPEGGAKGILYIDMRGAKTKEEERERLYAGQKAYVKALLSIVNCDVSGKLKEKFVIDYYKLPEYLYLGPDENMHDSMIEWIASYSKSIGYPPGVAFITGKARSGINHKEFGVTSFGVTVALEHVLRYLGIDKQESITFKMVGGPDGDVAGNCILCIDALYGNRAHFVAITDISGTIFDPLGLDVVELKKLVKEQKSVSFYPRELLSAKGFLLIKHDQAPSLYNKADGEKLISNEECQRISASCVHGAIADVFIPAGGRPRSLDETNKETFLDEKGNPTSKVIIEGANVYLSQVAREFFEEKGVLIIKDASANKGGVISSSYEVLAALVLSEEEFIQNKEQLVAEILEKIKELAVKEVDLILQLYTKEKKPASLLSNEISDAIIDRTEKILEKLQDVPIPTDSEGYLLKPFFAFSLPFLRNNFKERLLDRVPDGHKKAIIASYLGSNFIYTYYAPKVAYPVDIQDVVSLLDL